LIAEIKVEVLDETDDQDDWQSFVDCAPEQSFTDEPNLYLTAPVDQFASRPPTAQSNKPASENTYSLHAAPLNEMPLDRVDPLLAEDNQPQHSERTKEAPHQKKLLRRKRRPERPPPERKQPERKGRVASYSIKQPRLPSKSSNMSQQIQKKYRLVRGASSGDKLIHTLGTSIYNEQTGKLHRGKRGEGAFICDQCSYRFRTKNSLGMHYAVHLGETKCPVCKHVFSRKDDMLHHLFSRHYADTCILKEAEKQSHCWLCPKKFTNPSGLKVHAIREHLDYSHCPICKMTFSIKTTMLNHLFELHEHKAL